MAGYLFTFEKKSEGHLNAMRFGRYSTNMGIGWGSSTQGTLGDYITMRPGDSVYFFSDRIVYGIGAIVEVMPGYPVLENYEGATNQSVSPDDVSPSEAILPRPPDKDGKPRVFRWVVSFEPDPLMFRRGVDMDDLLNSNPEAFRSLRVIWKRSFIKLDDTEEMAFRAAILRRNLDVLTRPSADAIVEYDGLAERERMSALAQRHDLSMKVGEFVRNARQRDGSLRSEMALECALLHQWMARDATTEAVFGRWDYLSHQVHASPAKPVDYMDKMDVFGYRWIPGYAPIIEKYLVCELKKDVAKGEDLQQVMKYVDWVESEYANGDYSMVSAFLVAQRFDMESIEAALPSTERWSLLSARPPKPLSWHDLTLVEYSTDDEGRVEFRVVRPGR